MKRLLPLLTLLLLLASCRSSKDIGKSATLPDANASKEVVAARAYMNEVVEAMPQGEALTAKLRVEGRLGEKSMTLGGQLRMKRGEVVQIALSLLGMEVARLEFTPQSVLLVNRVKKTYARVGYSALPQLGQLGLDYRALEAIFWNELFAAGTPSGATLASQLTRFALTTDGTHRTLTLNDAPKLTYQFFTAPQSRRIDGVKAVEKTNAANALTCSYADFQRVDGLSQTFPAEVKLEATYARRTFGLNMQLSRFSTTTSFDTRTTLSSRYKEVTAEEALKF